MATTILPMIIMNPKTIMTRHRMVSIERNYILHCLPPLNRSKRKNNTAMIFIYVFSEMRNKKSHNIYQSSFVLKTITFLSMNLNL
jgi:hypothetical protein